MKRYIFIGAGGFAGAILRYLAEGIKFQPSTGVFPLNTLIINVSGCFFLALFLTIAMELWEVKAEVRLGIVTGLLGAFTTFSTLCGEAAGLLDDGFYLAAASYIIISAMLGTGFIYLANSLGREVIARRVRGGAR